METKHISNRKKIGFITYDMEVAEVSEIVKEGVEIINTQNEQVSLAPEHQEVLNRIDMAQTAIIGKKFAKLSIDKKKELLDELVWLTAINNRLIKSY